MLSEVTRYRYTNKKFAIELENKSTKGEVYVKNLNCYVKQKLKYLSPKEARICGLAFSLIKWSA